MDVFLDGRFARLGSKPRTGCRNREGPRRRGVQRDRQLRSILRSRGRGAKFHHVVAVLPNVSSVYKLGPVRYSARLTPVNTLCSLAWGVTARPRYGGGRGRGLCNRNAHNRHTTHVDDMLRMFTSCPRTMFWSELRTIKVGKCGLAFLSYRAPRIWEKRGSCEMPDAFFSGGFIGYFRPGLCRPSFAAYLQFRYVRRRGNQTTLNWLSTALCVCV